MAATVSMKSGFFLTPEGEIALEAYDKWNKGSSDSDEIKKRKEKLVASGLMKAGAAKLAKGTGHYVTQVLKGKEDGLSMTEIVAAIQTILDKEGNGEKVNSRQVNSYMSFTGLDHKDRDDETKLIRGEIIKEGDDDDATYRFKTDDEKEADAKKDAKPAKKKEAK